jgi:hypothetical protein
MNITAVKKCIPQKIDARLRIVFLSDTNPGKTHDKTLADKLESRKNLRLKSDLGFTVTVIVS